ncbi:MAG TPA: SigE family RNA polymerase sigma factor [Pseudonocardiaceae bacterium]|nr:SigE family RNA polymerase sigma factor [Pseudonocardiaceae bacterium]
MTYDEFAVSRLRPLLRAARAICGEPSLAEDLVQDVLLKVQLQWRRIEKVDNPDAYLHRMLVNEYLSWRRKWSRIALHSDIELTESRPDHAAQHADRDALRLQILRLPRQQQVVLALRYYAGLSDTEIADALGCAAATVRGYASRALATLRADARGQLIGIEGTAP